MLKPFYRLPSVASEPNLSSLGKVSAVIILTAREIEVVRLLGDGCTYEQVALRLGVSPHTVVSHVKNAYRKLDVHSAAAAVLRAFRLGLMDSGAPTRDIP